MKTFPFLLMVLLVSCATGMTREKIKVAEASKLIEAKAELQILDVRRPDEFDSGRLKNALLVTWGEEGFEKEALAKLSKDKPVLVYCRSGRRSTAATEALKKLGFRQLHNLDGGITAWQEAGQPVVK